MAAVLGMTTASGVLALLEEPQEALQRLALQKLNGVVDVFWPEVADKLDTLEALSADASFDSCTLAALVASKVYFHLGRLTDAMEFALAAEDKFDLSAHDEYSHTIIARCVDEYSRIKKLNAKKQLDASTKAQVLQKDVSEIPVQLERIDLRLEAVIERLFDRCFEEKEFRQAAGMAVESLRLDIVEKVVRVVSALPESAAQVKSMLQYIFDVASSLVVNRNFRGQLLTLLVRLYQETAVADYVNVVRCLVFLDRPGDVASLLNTLVSSGREDDVLLSFQLAFELVENATQKFLKTVKEGLPQSKEVPKGGALSAVETDVNTLQKILSGTASLSFFLEFLYSKNKADLSLLKKLKELFEPRNSVLHQSLVVANAVMHCGTTRDTFLRENLEWLARATNWAKFLATASLGVIHKHHLSEAMNILDPYLPKPGVDASPYTEGGSLFGLGLIHANQGATTVTHYILECLKNVDAGVAANPGQRQRPGELDETQKKEIVQHGAALGLGVAAMASGLEDVFEELMNLVYHHDSAVAGEAAGMALGLVMLGTATERSAEMLRFAHVTQHEKIIRSIGLGLALIMYSLEEKADPMIETLTNDKDPLLRYGGMFTIGLSYAGTANNNAIKKLLHYAVSDVSDDVRRAAVMSLGFVLFRRPEQVPRLVALLSESYNPHVRYGAAIAIGVACAGSGMKEAVEQLLVLAKDSTHFVRQGAFIALALVLVEISEKANPKVKDVREMLLGVVSDKHQPQPAKLGAIFALGILDAGGRNCTIALTSRSGHTSLTGVVGLFVFLQYWYWYPFMLFISLAFTPTAIIAVNKDLAMPQYAMRSNAKPSLFAPYQPLVAQKEEEVKTVAKAELSITKKARRRAQRKTGDGDAMDIDLAASQDLTASQNLLASRDLTASQNLAASQTLIASQVIEKKEDKKEPEPEPETEILQNPARVTRQQLKVISYDVDERYKPIVTSESLLGIIVLKDQQPSAEAKLIAASVPVIGGAADSFENEPEPPASFEFLG